MDRLTRLFVYGSLMQGMPYADRMAGARLEGKLETSPDYLLVLYREGYPALAIAGSSGASQPMRGQGVPGEAYWVTSEHLARLDVFEECPRLYQREAVVLADGSLAQAYCISPESAAGWPRIERWEPTMTRRAWTS